MARTIREIFRDFRWALALSLLGSRVRRGAGRMFTVVLAYGGIFTLAYFMTELVRTVLTGELRDVLGRQRMEDELARLNGHLVVCGLGRMGKIVCDELERQSKWFVVIDTTAQGADEVWPYKFGYRVHGNATEDELLRRAGVDRASALITTVGSDSDNLYITLSARLINSKMVIVARAEEETAEAKLRKVGATKVISPYLTGGHRAVQTVLRPTVCQLLEPGEGSPLSGLQLEEVRISPSSRLAGRTLAETKLRQELGVAVIGLVSRTGTTIYNPAGDAVLEADATVIALGSRDTLEKFERIALGTI